MALKFKEQKVMYTAYCKDCNKDIADGFIQAEVFLLAAKHNQKDNHELIFGMLIKYSDDALDEMDKSEHVTYCKECRKNIAVSTDDGKVLRSAMEHCEDTKHELAFGVVIKPDMF